MTPQMTPEQKGLRFAAAVTLLTGLGFAAAAFPPTNALIRLLIDLTIWPFDSAETLAAPETRLGLAIGGGVMAGWGAMIWQLLGVPYARDPEAIRSIILSSVLIWFAIDSTASILAGAALNGVGNVALLALFLVPIIARRRVDGHAA
jgi:hypothetical protein